MNAIVKTCDMTEEEYAKKKEEWIREYEEKRRRANAYQKEYAKRKRLQKQGQDLPFLVHACDGMDAKSLRLMSDALRDIEPNWMYLLYTTLDDNLHVIVSIPKALQAKVGSAGDWVKKLCAKGGGRPDFAQGGGPVPHDLAKQISELVTQGQALLKS